MSDGVELNIRNVKGDTQVVLIKDGEKGDEGVGIVQIYKEKSEGLVDTYVIEFSNGKNTCFSITNGKDGKDGEGAVLSVNGKTGTVVLKASDVKARADNWMPTATDVGARPDNWMPTAEDVGARPITWTPSAEDVGARPSNWMPSADDVGARPNTWTPSYSDVGAEEEGTAGKAVIAHNISTDAHSDIRDSLQTVINTITDILDSDDVNLNELHEIVAYIKNNKDLIDQITVNKVSVSDIVNNLTSNATNKPLSAYQGAILNGLIDGLASGKLDASKLTEAINTALAQAKASGEFDGAPGAPGANGVGITKAEVVNGKLIITYSTGSSIDAGKVKGDDGVLTPDQEELLAIIPDLKKWYDEETYVELAFKKSDEMPNGYLPNNSGTTFEMGTSNYANVVNYSWEFNKTPTTLTVDDSSMPVSTTSYSKSWYSTGEISTDLKIYATYDGKYGKEEVTKTYTYNFKNKKYYGARAEGTINDAFIKGLTGQFASDYKHSGFNLGDSSADKYVWYCFPYRFEDDTKGKTAPTFTLGGYQGGFIRIGTVSFTNSSGYTEDYSVYRSTNKGVAKANVTVS